MSQQIYYYTSTAEFKCAIGLHAHQMYVRVMDRQGKKLAHCNAKDNDFEYFLKLSRMASVLMQVQPAIRPLLAALWLAAQGDGR